MVAGGFYKLHTKKIHTVPEQESQATVTLNNKCPRLYRWKLWSFVFVTVVIVIFLGSHILSPLARTHNHQLSNTSQLNIKNKISSKVRDQETKDGKGNIRYKHTRRNLPSCLIIGARKAGTRALLTYLNLHPQIITAKQEVHYFDDNYERGLDWYRKAMPYSFPETVTMEKTPAYFVEDVVPERVFRLNSSMRLLLVVRDPVERTISDYNQIMLKKQSKNKSIPSFEELVIGDNGEVNKSNNAIKRSIYARHMAKWLKFFPLEQFHIVSGEGLIDNPFPHIQAVEDFLQLEHRVREDNFFFNDTRGFFCIRNETMEKCLNASKGRPHPVVRQDILHKLRLFFRPFNEKFYSMIHKNFGWP